MKKKNTNPICHGKSPRLGTIGNHQIKAAVWAVLFLTKSDAFLKNCIIADLNPGSSTAPAAIYRIIKTMPDINKNQRQKKLSLLQEQLLHSIRLPMAMD